MQLNQEKSHRLIEDDRAELARLRELELQKQREREAMMGKFCHITVDTKNIRGNRQKNADHLNKYKLREMELLNEIENLEKDLAYSNKQRTLFEL
jgi:hypothetical protein